MSAVIYKLRDYQNPKDIERMQRELEKEAKAILGAVGIPTTETIQTITYGGQGIDGMFIAPDKDPA